MRRRRRLGRRRTARDAGLDKKRLWREIDADLRRKDREKLAALRADVRAARERRRMLLREAKAGCRDGRVLAALRAKEILVRAKEEARAMRLGARASCASTTASARELRSEIGRLRTALLSERQHQREIRAIARSERQRARGTVGPGVRKARHAERQGESDDEVRQNIPPELVPLFNRVRRSIKGSPRKSRTEAFLEYAEEHPGEEYAGIEEKTDALVAELERQARAGRRDRRRRRRARRTRFRTGRARVS